MPLKLTFFLLDIVAIVVLLAIEIHRRNRWTIAAHPWACEQCPSRFRSADQLSLHIAAQHDLAYWRPWTRDVPVRLGGPPLEELRPLPRPQEPAEVFISDPVAGPEVRPLVAANFLTLRAGDGTELRIVTNPALTLE